MAGKYNFISLFCVIIALSGCTTLETVDIPEWVYNKGDSVEVLNGDFAGQVGRIVGYNAQRTQYTLEFGYGFSGDFDRQRIVRSFEWTQLRRGVHIPRRSVSFNENDHVEIIQGLLAGKTGRVVRVNSLLNQYVISLDGDIHEAREFHADELKLWTEKPPSAESKIPPTIAVVPFTGFEVDDDLGETLAWQLANIPDIAKSYTPVPSTFNIRRKTNDELYLNYNQVNYSPALDIGEKLNTDYIMTGYLCMVGSQNVVLVVLLDKNGRLVSGDYKSYLNTQQIPTFFPSMIKKMLQAAEKNTAAEKPRLAVRTIAYPRHDDIKPSDAEVLSNLLAADIANFGKFAVFPRDGNETIKSTLENEEEKSIEKSIEDKTKKTPAEYVLSGKIALFNTKNQFLAEIVRVDNSMLKTAGAVDFGTVEDAMSKMYRLAGEISAR
jgi:ribosomal protein L24/TolB-like protein